MWKKGSHPADNLGAFDGCLNAQLNSDLVWTPPPGQGTEPGVEGKWLSFELHFSVRMEVRAQETTSTGGKYSLFSYAEAKSGPHTHRTYVCTLQILLYFPPSCLIELLPAISKGHVGVLSGDRRTEGQRWGTNPKPQTAR